MNGKSQLTAHFGLGTAATNSDNSNVAVAPKTAVDMLDGSKKVDTLKLLSDLLPVFEELSIKSLDQQEQRMLDESAGNDPRRTYVYRKEAQKALQGSSKTKQGFIIWLDLNKKKVSIIIL